MSLNSLDDNKNSSNPSTSLGLPKIILFDEGWNKIYSDGILRLETILSSNLLGSFSNREYVDLYTTIYQMCIQKAPYCFTQQLYDKYESTINQYLSNTALRSINNKSLNSELLAQEFVRRWEDHRIYRKWLFDFFRYIDRFYVKRHNKLSLQAVAIIRFKEEIFDKVKAKLTSALLDLIKRDRLGESIDRQLVREILNIYIDLGKEILH
jgi:cullin 1